MQVINALNAIFPWRCIPLRTDRPHIFTKHRAPRNVLHDQLFKNTIILLAVWDGILTVVHTLFYILSHSVFIIGGAIMFWQFEEDWTLLMSVYYCAITATTIGFGDLVPNTSLTNSGGWFKALATILYITFSKYCCGHQE